jgi:hypothetical protein
VGFLFCDNTHGYIVEQISGRRTKQMGNQVQEKPKRGLSLDGWAVGIALLLAALVKLGALKHVGW